MAVLRLVVSDPAPGEDVNAAHFGPQQMGELLHIVEKLEIY